MIETIVCVHTLKHALCSYFEACFHLFYDHISNKYFVINVMMNMERYSYSFNINTKIKFNGIKYVFFKRNLKFAALVFGILFLEIFLI